MSLLQRRHEYHRILADWPSLTREHFDALAQDALDLLPNWARPYLERVVVVVEDEPPPDEDPDLLGLYTGSTVFGETDSSAWPEAPHVVTVYQGPHERQCHSHGELRVEVAETILHEIAHHFGIEEETLDEIGPIERARDLP